MSLTLPHLTLVLGAAASGKSGFAEHLAEATRAPMAYIATAQVLDEEMRVKIVAHRARRGSGWTTIEAPYDLATPLTDADPASVVLVDCATLWLSNLLLQDADLTTEETRLLKALAACPAPVIMVSNEVGAGIVPDNALARRFRSAQGRLNQSLAARADLVVAVMAGLPVALKGEIPAGLA